MLQEPINRPEVVCTKQTLHSHTNILMPISRYLCHQLGPVGDVKLFRSSADTLTVEGAVSVSGELHTKDIKVNGMDLSEYVREIVKQIVESK